MAIAPTSFAQTKKGEIQMLSRIMLASGIMLLGITNAFAKGGSTGGIEHVSDYTKANGTHVDAYDRRAPGTVSHSNDGAMVVFAPSESVASLAHSGGSSDSPLTFGSAHSDVPATPRCEFKSVMSDEDIRLCRQESVNTSR